MSDNNSSPNGKEDKPPDPMTMSEDEPASSSQSASNNSTARHAFSSGTQQSNSKPPSQRLAGIGFVLLIVLVVVATHFYIKDGTPLVQLPGAPPPFLSPQANPAKQAVPSVEPAFVLLGEYKGEVYTYNKGTKRVYAYKIADKTEREVCKLVEFDDFSWHTSGKLLVVSRRHSTQGGIYLLDLNLQKNASQQPAQPDDQSQTEFEPKPVLLTNREADPYFPRNLSIERDLPLVWGKSGERFAFVARDIQDTTQSLFIYNLDNKQNTNQNDNKLIYTPARNFEHITDLVWIDSDKQLVFAGINDDRENRYRVDKNGGDFRAWDGQP